MSDDRPDDVTGPDEPTTPEAAPAAEPRTGNAAAAAASRARRIGGRTVTPGGVDRSTIEPVAPSLVTRTSGKDGGKDEKSKKPSRKERRAAAADTTTTDRRQVARGVPDDRAARDRASGVRVLAWVPAVVLSLAAIGMAVVLLVTRVGGDGGPNANTVRDQVLAAAKTCIANTNTYSYKNLDAFEKKGLACGTGTFAVQFKQSVDDILKKNAAAVKQVQTFQVNYAGVSAVSAKDQWDILIYGQVSVTNAGTGAAGRIDPYGAVARMVKIDGSWRMSNLGTLCTTTLLASGNKCD